MGYEIRIVSNEEFDTLPYKKAKTSLGLADPKTGVAYVRETGVRELDQATIDHEFDELIQQISPHEEDGIRYKSGGSLGQIFAPILGAVLTPFIGPAGGAIAGALLGGGTKYHTQSTKPEKYGKPSFGSIAGSAATGALGAYGGGQMASGALSGASAAKSAGTSQLMGGLKGAFVGAPGVTGGANVTSTGIAVPSTFTPATSGLLGTGGTFGAAGSSGLNKLTSTAGRAGNVLNTFGSVGLGTDQQQPGLFPAGRTPASNVGQFEESATSPGALSRFLPGVQSSYTPGSDYTEAVSQADFDRARSGIATNKASRLQSVMDQFRSIRPGATPETDTALARALGQVNTSSAAELEQLRKEADEANTAKYGQYQNVQRYNDIMNVNKLTNEKMRFYIDLAKKTDAEITAQVSNTPEEFRSIFGNLTAIG